MSLPPSEIPLGAMRFNSDSQKLEYWNGSAWMQIQTFSPNLGTSSDTGVGARGLILGGDSVLKIDYFNIQSQGNAQDFGDIANVTYQQASFGSNTRCFVAGGAGPSTNPNDVIEFVNIISLLNIEAIKIHAAIVPLADEFRRGPSNLEVSPNFTSCDALYAPVLIA